jgi:hypothetical protein
MNKNFIFFVISCALFVLSIIAANVAPIISKAFGVYNGVNVLSSWGTENCQQKDDDYKHDKDILKIYEADGQKPTEEQVKRKIKECKNHNTMYSLEYAALIIDVSLGFICTVLGLIYYLEPGKPLEKQSGLIGLIAGVITTVLTVVYVAFSAMIFSNDPVRSRTILYPNKASVKYNGVDKYVFDYDEEKARKEDLDIPLIKYKDLGKKQYNYDSEIFESSKDTDSEFSHCQINIETDLGTLTPIPKTYISGDSNTHECKYLWDTNVQNSSTNNKYLYDRWLTCIIFCVLIAVCGIGLIIFGFLLFTGSSDSQPSPSTVPEQS